MLFLHISLAPSYVPISPSATPTSSNHPTKPSTVSSNINDSVPLVTSLAVGSHRSPTFQSPTLPVPPTSLAVGSNRPLSPGNRVSPSPNGEKPSFQPPSGFGLNIALGVWSPLGNMNGNGHHDSGGVVKPQSNGTGNVCICFFLLAGGGASAVSDDLIDCPRMTANTFTKGIGPPEHLPFSLLSGGWGGLRREWVTPHLNAPAVHGNVLPTLFIVVNNIVQHCYT